MWQPELAPAVGTVWKLSLPLLGLSGVVQSGKLCNAMPLRVEEFGKRNRCHRFTAPLILSASPACGLQASRGRRAKATLQCCQSQTILANCGGPRCIARCAAPPQSACTRWCWDIIQATPMHSGMCGKEALWCLCRKTKSATSTCHRYAPQHKRNQLNQANEPVHAAARLKMRFMTMH